MWGVCEWLCPKRQQKREAYDVHEDTFEMDENIGELPSEISSPKFNDDEQNKYAESN